MIKRLQPKSEFSRNVLTLMTGTTIAQAIPIAISPILTRLYSPEDFGLLALFVALTTTLSSIANGKYEIAIMLPEKDEDAINIAALGLLIALSFSIVLLLPVIFFNTEISESLGSDSIGFWLYFSPFVVLIMGLYNVLNYLNNRKKLYTDLAKANVYRSTAGAAVQLIVGFLKEGVSGLITGQIVSAVVANAKLAKNTTLNYKLKNINYKKIKILGKQYIDFPKYTMWATLANSLSQNLVSVFIPIVYSMSTLGLYSLVQRVLGVPASLIGGAIGQVFHQEVSREKELSGAGVKAFNSTIKKLLLIAIPSFLLMYLLIEDVFIIVFGENWQLAGEYARILIPLFFIRFVIGTVSVMNSVFLKNKNGLIFQMSLMTMSLITLYISNIFDLSAKAFFELLTSLLFLTYMLFGFYLNRLKYGVENN